MANDKPFECTEPGCGMPTLINMKSNKLTVAATNSQKCVSFSPLPGPDAETGSTLSVVSTSSEVLHTRLTPQVEIVSNLRSGNISSISPAAVDDADSCGSFTTVAVTDDSIACANEMPAGIAMPSVYYILIKSSSGSVIPMPIPPAAPSDANVPVGFPASTTSTLRTLLAIPKSNIEKPVKLEVRSTISCTMTVAAPQFYCSAQPRTVCDVATSSGVAISTKERLKAAIQQNSQVNSVNVMHSNMKVMSDAVDWITANQLRVASATPLSLNRSTSTVGTTAIEPASSVVARIANQQIKLEDADTSTPPPKLLVNGIKASDIGKLVISLCQGDTVRKQMRFSTSDDDAEYRRQQFLERNSLINEDISTEDLQSFISKQKNVKTEDLQSFISKQKNVNTTKKTLADNAKFKNWLIKQGIKENPEKMDLKHLDTMIGRFIMNMKKEDGSEYEPDSIVSIHRSIHRYLRQYDIDIVQDIRFRMSREVLNAKRKELKSKGLGNRPKRAEPIDYEQEEKLWTGGQLGSNNAESLQNTLWYFNTKLLGLRGVDEHRQLRWGDMCIKLDETGKNYLEFNERQIKTRNGIATHSRSFAPKIFPNLQCPDRCPIAMYLKFLSKRPLEMNEPESPYYLSINHTVGKQCQDVDSWYKRQPMGVNTLGKIMKSMAVAAQLQGRKTNHSVRRTMYTELLRAGIAPTTCAAFGSQKLDQHQ